VKILNAFKKIVGIQPSKTDTNDTKYKQSGTVQSTPAYPPADEGIALIPIRDVLESQADLLRRIKLSSGMKQEVYRAYMVPVLERFIRYAHLLPATKNQHHRGAGGLLRMGLETAFYSMQAADGVIFAGLEATERKRDMEERWRYATFLSGLCMDLYRLPNSMVVTSVKGIVLDPHEHRLFDWATKNDISRYYVQWSAGEFKSITNSDLIANGPLMHMIIPSAAFAYLNATGQKPMNAMLSTITGTVPNSEILTINKIVTEMRRKVIERDSSLQPELYGKLSVGVHIEPHIIDAMRRLISRGTWGVNKPSARIWYGTDGMYILWRRDMAEEIVTAVHENKVQGFPSEPDSILDLMLKSNIVIPSSNGGCFELNASAAIMDEKCKWRTVMRLSNPEMMQGEGCTIEKANVSFLATPKPKTPAKPSTIIAKPSHNTGETRDAKEASTPEPKKTENVTNTENIESQQDLDLDDATQKVASAHEAEVENSNYETAYPSEEPASQSASDKLLMVLPNSVADVIRAMSADYQSECTGFSWVQQGFAISYAKMVSYGMSPMVVVESLNRNSWILLDGKKMVHNIEIDGKSEMAIVLIAGIAERLGFSRKGSPS